MESRNKFLAIGVVVLVSLASVAVVLTLLLGGGMSGVEHEELTVVYDGDVSGLKLGSAVTFNGVPVGKVTNLYLSQDNPSLVFISVSVNNQTPIKVDSEVSLGYSGITGVTNIRISGGTERAPSMFAAGSKRKLKARLFPVRDIIEGARKVIGQTDESLSTISSILRDNEDTVLRIVKNVELFTTNLELFSRTISSSHEAVEPVVKNLGNLINVLLEISPQAHSTLTSLDRIISTFDKEDVTALANGLRKLTSSVSIFSSDLKQITDNITAASSKTTRLVDTAEGTIANLERIAAAIDTEILSKTLESTSETAKALTTQTEDIAAIIADIRGITAKTHALLAGDIDEHAAVVATTIQHIKTISDNLNSITHYISGADTSNDKRTTASGLSVVLSDIQTLLRSATQVTYTLNAAAHTVDTNSSNITNNVKRLTSSGQETLDAIKNLADGLDQAPQRILFGRTKNESIMEHKSGR